MKTVPNATRQILSLFCVVLCLLGGISRCLGQSGRSAFEKEGSPLNPFHGIPSRSSLPGQTLQVRQGPLEIVHYDLDVKLAMVDENFGGVVTITSLLVDPSDTVVLNAVSLEFDSVTVDGQNVPVQWSPVTESFSVLLGRIHPAGDTLRIRIVYRRLPGVPRPASRLGYYYFPTAVGVPASLGYTMSEPSDARFWLPCLDEPWAKATASIRATVPTGYVAASNGRLQGMLQNGDGTVTWQWDETHRIAPYLMCVTASAFDISSVPYVRGVNDTIPVQYYTWPVDAKIVSAFLPTVQQMIRALSSLYGPYPFEKYGMSSIVPFAYGGMEHQTMTTLNEYLQADEDVVVHELAHQWWGDLVTCGSWEDIWLNEGFASYSEALWAEAKGGPSALRQYLTGLFLQFDRGSWQGAVYDPVSQGFNLFDAVVYTKAAWVLHTLRGVLGDSTFFRTLRAYRTTYAEESASTAQFEAVVDSVVGGSMGWFFNQWIYGAGWPRLNANFTWSTGVLRVVIQQLQTPPWPLFRLPMVVRARSGMATIDFAVVDSLATQAFNLPLAQSPLSVLVDPDNWVLKEISGSAAGDQTGETFTLFQNFPNPFNSSTEIRFTVPVPARVKLTVLDVLGREMMVILDEDRAPGYYATTFNGSRLASGVYFYRLDADRDEGGGRTTHVGKMIILR